MTESENQQLEDATVALISEHYGSQASAIQAIRLDLAKAELAAYKAKVDSQKPIFEKRREAVKSIPKFWLNSLLRGPPQLVALIDIKDRDALGYLIDVWLDHGEDPREVTWTFSFSADNPYFKERTLKKVMTLKKKSNGSIATTVAADTYDISHLLQTEAITITWTSPKHDLASGRPRIDPTELEEYDEFQSLGSFFNWFIEGHDNFEISEILLEWWPEAHDSYAQLTTSFEDDEDHEGDEDDSDQDDIDIEESESEKPVSKKRKSN